MHHKRIIPGELHHVFQRSYDRGLLFYSASDVLTYFTIFMTKAAKYKMRVLGLCTMRDHIHSLLIPPSSKSLAGFEMATNRTFAREFNSSIGRSGPVFEHSYDFAVKRSGKVARSSIIYLYNNPVEKHLCRKAVEARWNFLAYGLGPYPFSSKLILRRASSRMRRCVEETKACHSHGEYLKPVRLCRMFGILDVDERKQLCDFIIQTYSVIDYRALFSYWKSPEDMLVAANSATGAEYDIAEKEERFGSDKVYGEISSWILKQGGFKHLKDVLLLSEQERYALAVDLQEGTSASLMQIHKFLHLKV